MQPGSIVDGKYRIERQVGAGAMGAVYEAEHTGTGRRVAIKVINSGDVARDKALVGRFQREAKAAGAIDTQHITQVLDVGVDHDGSPFLVMEYLVGEDLQHIFQRLGPVSIDLALRLTAQACLGLQKAHEASVVHRDIKPANLFLARRDAGERIVKLLDFGIAKVKMDHANDTENAALTKTGSMLGSPLYMSPEQAKGLKTIDHRADLWSLGIVLYQALTGHTPHDHCDALGSLIIAICHDEPIPVQQHAPWIPPEVAAIVHQALRRNPQERFQSAAQMFDAIRPLIPYGWTIVDDMLIPLSDTFRSHVAPRLELPSYPGAGAPLQDSHSIPPGHPGSLPPPRMGSVPNFPGVANTTGALTQSAPAHSPARGPKIAVGALAAAAAIAAGAYFLRGTIKGPAAVNHASSPSSIEIVVSAAPQVPVVTPSASAEAVKATEGSSNRRVKLVILPEDATVEVEDVKTPLRDGLLEIMGTPGSVHRVRVFKGKNSVTTDVVITEVGPSPPKIELAATPAGGKGGPPGPRPSSSAPVAPALPPGIRTDFP